MVVVLVLNEFGVISLQTNGLGDYSGRHSVRRHHHVVFVAIVLVVILTLPLY